MSVRLELLHATPAREAGRRLTTGPVLATAAVVLGLAVSAVAAFAQSQPGTVFPPPADFTDAAPAASQPASSEARTEAKSEAKSDAKSETSVETKAAPKVQIKARPAAAPDAPLPPPRPVQAENKMEPEPAKRLERETRPARRSQKLAYLPAARDSRKRHDGFCLPPRIVIDDYWRGGPIIDCHGRFRPR
jgi:hypothetical protein